jgi:hypothetical protein
MIAKKIYLYDSEECLTDEIKPIKTYDLFGIGYPYYFPQIGSEISINETFYKVENVIYHDTQECVDVMVHKMGLFDN